MRLTGHHTTALRTTIENFYATSFIMGMKKTDSLLRKSWQTQMKHHFTSSLKKIKYQAFKNDSVLFS